MSEESEAIGQQVAASRGPMPKLRFPEFCDAPEWEARQLKSTCQMRAGKFISAAEIREMPADGWCPCYGGNGLRGFTKTHTHTGKYPLIGRQGALCGNVTLATGRFYATEHAIVASPGHNVDTGWLFYELTNLNLNQYATGQAQPGLSVEILEKIITRVPAKEHEQQKIAACLASVDELITAQGKQLGALRSHKEGLMQQLLPAEGATLPGLRFPGFRRAPPWQLDLLGRKATKVGSGITPNGGERNYKTRGRPFIRSQNVGWGQLILDDVVFIDDITHSTFPATQIETGDVFINITGASIGRSAVADSRVAGGNVNQHVCIIRTASSGLYPYFLNQYLLSKSGQRQIDSFRAGGNRQGLNFAQVRSFCLPLPSLEEQQQVANCLSSLDELILAQAHRIDALRIHKKGLMRQLFPSVDELQR